MPVPASGTPVTLGASAPTNSTFNIAAVEVKAAAGGSTLNQTAGYNAIDELTTLNGSTTALTYDADGNETANPGSATRPGSNYAATASRTETYNGRDQQTGITPTGGNPISNSYLGETNTTQLATTDTITGINTTFSNTMLGIVNVTNSATGSRQLLHTPSGQLIGAHVTAGSSYYLTDNLGSIVGMVDGNQHTQATYSYDPVGNTRSTSGPYPLLSNNPIRYAGGYQTTTGLIKFGARYYDPNTGRFTQPDPSGQETNPYTYAGDNPINHVDPTGYSFLGEVVGGIVGSTIAVGGCFLLSVETGGAGCVAAIAVGAGVGTALGGLSTGDSGEDAAIAGGIAFGAAAIPGGLGMILGSFQ